MTIGLFVTGFVVLWFVALVLALALCRAASDADTALGYKDNEDEEGPC